MKTCTQHNCGGTVICIVDKRGRIRWSSHDPKNESEQVGGDVIDLYPEETREAGWARISKWLMGGRSDAWTVDAYNWPMESPPQLVHKKITAHPFDCGEMAGLALVTVLPENYHKLTENDFTFLRLLVADKTLKEIAVAMDRSDSTIDARVKSLKHKLGCRTIAGLAAKTVWWHLT